MFLTNILIYEQKQKKLLSALSKIIYKSGVSPL